MNTLSMSLKEKNIQDNYKHQLFLETIKNGKTPSRSGLGQRIAILAGHTHIIYSGLQRNVHPTPSGFSEYTNVLNFYIGNNNPQKIEALFKSDSFKDALTKYLGHNIFHKEFYTLRVFFHKDVVPDWAIMDNDLKTMYPKKCKVDKRGFVYYKFR